MSLPQSELPRSHHLKRLVGVMVEALDETEGLSGPGHRALPTLVPADLTMPPTRNLEGGRSDTIDISANAIGVDPRLDIDRQFCEHRLARHHANDLGMPTHLIGDPTRPRCDVPGRVGTEPAVTLPIYVDDRLIVGLVFSRQGRDLSARERALVDRVRVEIARLFRRMGLLERAREAHASPQWAPPALSPDLPLSEREREVLRWVAAGKTDRDVAEILEISHRTVHKHLQRIYAKLGVETRTAAVMRALLPH